MNRQGFVTMAIAAWIAMGSFSLALGQTTRPTRAFMRQKIVYAQGLLEGVTLEKFDLVLTNAAPLRDMSHTNAFLLLKNPDYLQRITNFQVSVDALIRAAKEKDLDRTTRAYSGVTESCVNCHKYFRREQMIKRGVPGSPP